MAGKTPEVIDGFKTLINSYDKDATALRVLDASGANSNDIVLQDEVSDSEAYYGFAAPGSSTASASWKIIKKSVSGTVTSYMYANGSDSYTNIWTVRASLSYS